MIQGERSDNLYQKIEDILNKLNDNKEILMKILYIIKLYF